MWKNKDSQAEDPSYDAPRSAAGKSDSSGEIHVLRERESGPTSASGARPAFGAGSAPSRLGAGLQIKGEVSGTDDLIVEGSVEGTIRLEGHKLTVGPGAKLVADIEAAEIVVYGEVKGNLHARDRIELKKDGAVLGELTTTRIMIEDGAYFKGTIEIDRQAPAASQRAERAGRESESRPARETEAKVVPIPTGGAPSLHPPSFEKPAEKSAR